MDLAQCLLFKHCCFHVSKFIFKIFNYSCLCNHIVPTYSIVKEHSLVLLNLDLPIVILRHWFTPFVKLFIVLSEHCFRVIFSYSIALLDHNIFLYEFVKHEFVKEQNVKVILKSSVFSKQFNMFFKQTCSLHHYIVKFVVSFQNFHIDM